MSCDTGEIHFFSDYKHIETGTIKQRHALILVSKEVTDFIHGNCPHCSQDCKLYASPIEKSGRDVASFLLYKNRYPFLDTDRYCNIISSNLQQTCNQEHKEKGRIAKEDIPKFIEELKAAFRTTGMPKEINDPFFRGMIIQQWDELLR